jgi:glutamate racemase
MNPNIAFFDSGQGGLTVWEAVVRRLPSLNTVYLGDNARYPYGNKSADTVTRYSSDAAFFLSNHGASLIVVACGTASSVAVQALQRIFRVPIVGIVEGFCADAVSLCGPDGTIAVLGTRFTVASRRFEEVLRSLNLAPARIWQKACPLFVPLVEEGISGGAMAEGACALYLSDIPDTTRVVMLACTHFPRLALCIATTLERRLGRPVIHVSADGQTTLRPGTAGKDPIFLLDSSRAIVNIVDGFLATRPDRDAFLSSERRLFCSDAPTRFQEVAKLFASADLPTAELVQLGS